MNGQHLERDGCPLCPLACQEFAARHDVLLGDLRRPPPVPEGAPIRGLFDDAGLSELSDKSIDRGPRHASCDSGEQVRFGRGHSRPSVFLFDEEMCSAKSNLDLRLGQRGAAVPQRKPRVQVATQCCERDRRRN
jgi:hypothetical protein